MQWKATHIVKAGAFAPRRVMLNSGGYYTKGEWNDQVEPSFVEDEEGKVVGRVPGIFFAVSVTPLQGQQQPGSSITPLRKPVERLTQTTVRRGGKQRAIVLTLLPGDVVKLREAGCKRARYIPVMEIWGIAGKLEAAKLRADRKAKRAAKRK